MNSAENLSFSHNKEQLRGFFLQVALMRLKSSFMMYVRYQ